MDKILVSKNLLINKVKIKKYLASIKINILPDNPSLYKTRANAKNTRAVPKSF